jgi:hypothetical protein
MTKGELEAYTMLKSKLSTLIWEIEDYCRTYDCGRELKKACEGAKETLIQANKSFNKGKRKK